MSTDSRATRETRFVAWRRDRLATAGFPLPLASRVARDPRHDVHSLIELVERAARRTSRSASRLPSTKVMRRDPGYPPERVHRAFGFR